MDDKTTLIAGFFNEESDVVFAPGGRESVEWLLVLFLARNKTTLKMAIKINQRTSAITQNKVLRRYLRILL